MVQVEAREYDRGSPGGNDRLTQVIAFTGPAQTRVTTLDYDFRGRRTITRGERAFRPAADVFRGHAPWGKVDSTLKHGETRRPNLVRH